MASNQFPFRPRILEFLKHRPGRQLLTGDLGAGVTVGLIALPLSLALGIASIPAGSVTPLSGPGMGIITAIIGGLIVAILGGTRIQIGGPTAAFVPIVLLVVSQYGYPGLLVATMMAGGILILMGFSGMGKLVQFIPWPVTTGFTTGIAVSLILTQFPDSTGVQGAVPYPLEFIAKAEWICREISGIHLPTLGCFVISILVILLWPRLRIKWIHGSIVALVITTAFLWIGNLDQAWSLATIGTKFGMEAIPSTFPVPRLPTIDLEMIRSLIGPAIAIALLGAIESLLSAVVSDGMTGDHHDSSTELIAQGCANLVSPLFGGLPVTGAIARTSANIKNGGKSPLSGIIHALLLIGIVLVAAPIIQHIPMAVMSAILVVVAIRMGEWHELWHWRRLPVSDALVLFTTFILTVVFDLVIAVEVGMVLAAILFVRRIAETTEFSLVTAHDELETPEQIAHGKSIPKEVMVYRIMGAFLFGAARKMEDALSRVEELPGILIIRLHLVTAMDTTGLVALQGSVHKIQQRGGHVILSGLHAQPLKLMRKSNFIELIGPSNLCATFDDALERANSLLDNGEKDQG